MKKIVTTAIIIAAAAGAWLYFNSQKSDTDGSSDLIRVTTPLPNQEIESPLLVKGEARGFWFFEASFPVRLLDANGKELAVKPAQANPPAGGDWMTKDFLPFEVELEFSLPETQIGTLVLEKDNPSGLPENADELLIPVKFKNFSVPENR